MNDATRYLSQEDAIPRYDQFPSMDRSDVSPPSRASIESRRTLWGEYAAMLLAMNSGFAGVAWALRSPNSPAAAGLAAACLWICLRSMRFPVQKPIGVLCSSASVLFSGTVTAAGWIEAPPWLLRSPVSPFSITLMALAILAADLAVRGSTVGNNHSCDHPRLDA